MKLEQDPEQRETEILIRYAKPDRELERLTRLLQSCETRLRCRAGSREILVPASEVCYLESVDKKTFVYCETAVYQTELRLYQLLEQLGPLGFVQISKSCILNIGVLESIRSLPSSRMEATLKNGEHLLVNRKYLTDIRLALQEEEA